MVSEQVLPRDAQSQDGAPPSGSADADQTTLFPFPVAGLVALASGGLLTLAFPGTGWWPLAPLGVAGLTLAARGRRPRSAALLGLLTALAFFVPHLHWSGVYVGALPWLALATVESLYVAVMAALLPWAWRAPFGGAGTSLAVGGLWVAQEAVRGRWPFGGFPWGRLAFSQSEAPTLGLAAIGGAPLVTAAVAVAGGLLAIAVVAVTEGGRPGGRLAAVLALAASGGVLAAGLAVPTPSGSARTVRVAGVQGNVPRAGLEFNAERRAVLDNHARATIQLAADVAAGRSRAPDLVIWPENSSDIDPLRNPDAAAVISEAVDAIGVPTMVGAVLREPVGRLSNATLVWRPGLGPGDRYVKQHPAPFGEYIPYRSFFRTFSDKVDLVRSDFVAGKRIGLLDVGPARVDDVICFEIAYDDIIRAPVSRGADLLVVQTNNATFGFTDESVQQLAMSRLRAVETGRAVVHVSTVGVSAIIAPDGRVMERSPHFRPDVLEADVPLRTSLTPAVRLGAAPEWALAVLGLGLAGAGGWRVRRRRLGSVRGSGQAAAMGEGR